MRGKNDTRTGKRGGRLVFPGGKALQRLFAYRGRRNPALNDEVVASIPVPKSARHKVLLTARALRAASITRVSVRRKRTTAPLKAFARAIGRAADRLSSKRAARARKKPGRRMARPAPGTSPGAQAWQSIGPSRIPNGQTYGTNRIDVSGRIACIGIDPSDATHVLIGAACGGIWESSDDGSTWLPRTDQMPSLAIGAIAFDPANAKRVYVGSGEGNFYSNLGAGVYKSVDGGSTWKVLASAPFVGLGFFQLVVDPNDSSILYAATTNGLFKSTNAGAAWTVKRAVRCWNVSIHPQGGTIEILATFGDGLYVSTNGATSFTAVVLPGGPSSAWTRLAVDRVQSAADIAYVFGAAGNSAYLWRRQGTTWTRISLPANINLAQAWYDWYVAATPDQTDQVFIGAIDAYRGELTGTTWSWTNITTQGINSIHPDQHCLAFSPASSKILYAGCDGGIFRSSDSGATWKSLNSGLVITEIEYLASNPTTWKWLLAGTQDNGTIIFSGGPTWAHSADGDGGDCGVNQLTPTVVYHSFYDVTLERSSDQGVHWIGLKPPAMKSLFYPPVEVFGATVAIGGQSLAVTRSGADPWTSVSLGLGAGELATAMRDIDANTILVGTNQGKMLRVAWSGSAWATTVLTAPADRYVSCIAVDPSNPQRFWVTLSQLGGPSVFRSDDGGSSWVNCTHNLPAIPMNAIVVDPANFQRVWVAADVGVYQTLDLGASWSPFATGLPNAMAVDLVFHKQDRMLVCATRNRGAWAIQI